MAKKIESYIKSYDNHRLYYQAWKAKRPRAILVFVHGLNEHLGRYSYPIKYFTRRNYTVYLYDHRGHGKSDGLRSYVDSFDSYLKDLHEIGRFVSGEEKNKKIFVIGHSLGGQIVINYLSKYKNPFVGFILSSANIKMAITIPWIKRFLAFSLAPFFPRMYLGNEIDPKWLSRDHAVVRAYKKDPLVPKKTTLRLIVEIMRNQEGVMDLARKIRLPALITHAGADHICSQEGSRRFYRSLGASNKTLRIYDGYYHELFNELGKEKVFSDMDKWLRRQL